MNFAALVVLAAVGGFQEGDTVELYAESTIDLKRFPATATQDRDALLRYVRAQAAAQAEGRFINELPYTCCMLGVSTKAMLMKREDIPIKGVAGRSRQAPAWRVKVLEGPLK